MNIKELKLKWCTKLSLRNLQTLMYCTRTISAGRCTGVRAPARALFSQCLRLSVQSSARSESHVSAPSWAPRGKTQVASERSGSLRNQIFLIGRSSAPSRADRSSVLFSPCAKYLETQIFRGSETYVKLLLVPCATKQHCNAKIKKVSFWWKYMLRMS